MAHHSLQLPSAERKRTCRSLSNLLRTMMMMAPSCRLLLPLVALLFLSLPGPLRAALDPSPCPDALEIAPCVCEVTRDQEMDMDCSAVADGEDLRRVFQSNFPSTAFRRLNIYGNRGLLALRAGDLGNCSFREVWVTEGALEAVEPEALSGSFATAEALVFNYNSIHLFPFSRLPLFEGLLSLDLRHNLLRGFPQLASTTLQTLFLAKNPLQDLPVDAFAQTPALTDIQLSQIEISEVQSGTFSNLPNLKNVALCANSLTSIKERTVEFNNVKGLVDLGNNDIREVADNAFPGLTGWVYIHHNHLTELKESVWGSLLAVSGYIDPYDNPLYCGCDIAWLVRNSTLLDRVDTYTTCANGRSLRDLQASDYADC